MAATIKEEHLKKAWSSEKPVIFRGKKYRVGKMSYGDFFLEPMSFKGGERDAHSSETLWLSRVEGNPSLFQIDGV